MVTRQEERMFRALPLMVFQVILKINRFSPLISFKVLPILHYIVTHEAKLLNPPLFSSLQVNTTLKITLKIGGAPPGDHHGIVREMFPQDIKVRGGSYALG